MSGRSKNRNTCLLIDIFRALTQFSLAQKSPHQLLGERLKYNEELIFYFIGLRIFNMLVSGI